MFAMNNDKLEVIFMLLEREISILCKSKQKRLRQGNANPFHVI